eukprot:s1168_g11.t1
MDHAPIAKEHSRLPFQKCQLLNPEVFVKLLLQLDLKNLKRSRKQSTTLRIFCCLLRRIIARLRFSMKKPAVSGAIFARPSTMFGHAAASNAAVNQCCIEAWPRASSHHIEARACKSR